jgi:N-acetylglutamate synthase-like GNAT family acetyltransferase
MQDAADVRLATHADLTTCSSFDHTAGNTAIQYAIDQQAVVLAERNGKTIGYLRLEFLWSRVPYIALVMVIEDYRGQGVSRSMLDFIESQLRTNGHKFLLSSSEVAEASAQAWHRAVGFMECGIISGLNEGGIGEVFFRKNL